MPYKYIDFTPLGTMSSRSYCSISHLHEPQATSRLHEGRFSILPQASPNHTRRNECQRQLLLGNRRFRATLLSGRDVYLVRLSHGKETPGGRGV